MRTAAEAGTAAFGENAIGRLVGIPLETLETLAEQNIGQHGQAQRPEHHEAQHHQDNRCRRPVRAEQS
ncbi:hypothetical protein D3C87_1864640 [compost metagenome]